MKNSSKALYVSMLVAGDGGKSLPCALLDKQLLGFLDGFASAAGKYNAQLNALIVYQTKALKGHLYWRTGKALLLHPLLVALQGLFELYARLFLLHA
jgi:hypothetical protein